MPRAKKKETDHIINPKADGRNLWGAARAKHRPAKGQQTAAVWLAVSRRRLRTGASVYPAPMD